MRRLCILLCLVACGDDTPLEDRLIQSNDSQFQELERPAHWCEAVDAGLGPREATLHGVWSDAGESANADRVVRDLASLIGDTLRDVLRRAHPQARRILAD